MVISHLGRVQRARRQLRVETPTWPCGPVAAQREGLLTGEGQVNTDQRAPWFWASPGEFWPGDSAGYQGCGWWALWSRPSQETGVCWSTVLLAGSTSGTPRALSPTSRSQTQTAHGKAGFAQWPSSMWEQPGPRTGGSHTRPHSQPRLGPVCCHSPMTPSSLGPVRASWGWRHTGQCPPGRPPASPHRCPGPRARHRPPRQGARWPAPSHWPRPSPCHSRSSCIPQCCAPPPRQAPGEGPAPLLTLFSLCAFFPVGTSDHSHS